MTTKTNVLLLYPELADEVGVNEAIILSQLHYWIEKNKENHVNFRDGRTWVFQTYKEWNEQFTFWCEKTIKRIFLRLERQGYIISANYNKIGYDKTKWYTINYDELPFDLRTVSSAKQTDVPDGGGQKVPADGDYVTQPIQENNNRINKREYAPPLVSDDKEDERVGYGEYGWVRLTEDEIISLIIDYGEEATNRAITYIDTLAQQTGNRNGWHDWLLTCKRAIHENWGGIMNGLR